MSELACRREPGVIARRIAGEIILVPTTRRAREMALFTLNEVGTFLWERLETSARAVDLCQAVVEHFDVEPTRAARDVECFLTELASAGCARLERDTGVSP